MDRDADLACDCDPSGFIADVAEPDVAEPNVAERAVDEPDATGLEVPEPDVAEPDVAEPDVAEPDAGGREPDEPDVAAPVEPDVFGTGGMEPDVLVVGRREPDVAYASVFPKSETGADFSLPAAAGFSVPTAAAFSLATAPVFSVPTAPDGASVVQLPDTVPDAGFAGTASSGSAASQLARGGLVCTRGFLGGNGSTGGGVHVAFGFSVFPDFSTGFFAGASSGSGGSQLARGGFFGGSSVLTAPPRRGYDLAPSRRRGRRPRDR